jgi:poly(hydroxyalkanoate) depolymerase family esterase
MRRRRASNWMRVVGKTMVAVTRLAIQSGRHAAGAATLSVTSPRKPVAGPGSWTPGIAIGPHGPRRYRLFRPPEVTAAENLPLVVMLHGCLQDAAAFADCTRMNRVATRERFLVLYPEQGQFANPRRCWNWFDTANGRAIHEAASILLAIDQVCRAHPASASQVAIAGMSAGASMAALLVTLHPERFVALVMHSGIPTGTATSTGSALAAMRGHRDTIPLDVSHAVMAADWPPLLVIHGSADRVVAPGNGRAAVSMWAEAAGAEAVAPRTVRRGKRHPMTISDYMRRDRLIASLVEIEGLDHAWSGGAAKLPFSDAQGPDASGMAWRFIAKQLRLRGAVP